MNKKVISAMAMIGMTVGGCLPMLWGDYALDLQSIGLSMVGGFAGIWLGAWLSKRYF